MNLRSMMSMWSPRHLHQMSLRFDGALYFKQLTSNIARQAHDTASQYCFIGTHATLVDNYFGSIGKLLSEGLRGAGLQIFQCCSTALPDHLCLCFVRKFLHL